LEFTEQINAIAAELPTPITPRHEQLALMFLMLTLNKELTLIELGTGIGKSIMLALMAQYLCTIMGKKVLILVPSEVLKLD
jgi:predicted O-methyltransferase YrrM